MIDRDLIERKRERALLVLSEAINKAALSFNKNILGNKGYTIKSDNDYGLKNYTLHVGNRKSDKFYLEAVAVIVGEYANENIDMNSSVVRRIVREERQYAKNIIDMKFYENMYKSHKSDTEHLEDRYNRSKTLASNAIQKIQAIIKSQLAAKYKY